MASEELTELAELVGLLAEALNAAQGELGAMDGEHVPLPDGLRSKLEERLVLKATLGRVRAAAKTGRTITEPGLLATYREEREKGADVEDSLPPWPVLPEVEQLVEGAQEELTRALLRWPELRDVLDPMPRGVTLPRAP